ncbi:uncharacterized protein BDZ99DRAFT_481237 [Mytilinidion resinicola]|uniref:Uncharacterized protein n=1 Tax=Mytilinidion resinicola TaxID=574789 RepID=A0A6A6Y8X6_9PEZI|nr:uncharacterized protein BDZ99DRAFT_481237 [Mytilinidion resinicola]KAF2804414.1 hypothetical protein BDZ99DRAFT_481237 [Mytilinidion resinicola]
MRSLFALLDDTSNGLLLNDACAGIREEKVISLGKAFLSALAVAQAEDLEVVCSRLLPHKLIINRTPGSLTVTWEILVEHLSPPTLIEGLPSEAIGAESSPSSRPTSPTQPATVETLCDRDLFATYTTLEDPSPVHNTAEPTASVHLEAVDYRHDLEMQEYVEMPPASCSTSPTLHKDNIPNTTRHKPACGACELASETPHESHTTSPPSSPRDLDSNDCALDSSQISQPYGRSSSQIESGCSQSHFLAAFTVLTSIYSSHSEYALKPDVIIEIIKLGDSFL